MSGHTKGPWTFDETFYVWGPSMTIVGVGRGTSIEEQQANARLIAAAPELLAALRRMCILVVGTSAEGEAPYAEARAAISKAEGR